MMNKRGEVGFFFFMLFLMYGLSFVVLTITAQLISWAITGGFYHFDVNVLQHRFVLIGSLFSSVGMVIASWG